MKSIRYFFTLIVLIMALPPVMPGGPGIPASATAPVFAEEPDIVVVVRVYYDTIEDIQLLMNYDVFEYNNLEEKYVLVAVDQEDLANLRKLGLRVEIDEEQTANFNIISMPVGGQIATIPGYSCYRTVEETYQSAQSIANKNPTLATWIDIGDSWKKSVGKPDGHDMMVLKLTNSAITGDKPKLFVTGGIHAREYATPELVTRFAEYLVSNYGEDADATWLLDYHEVHLLLQTNPDGRKETENGISWRKNTNENYCGVTSKNRGADLNRNFNFQWDCCGGSNDSPCDMFYHGASPASEPEIQAVQNYMESIFPDHRDPNLNESAPLDTAGIFLDMHSYGREVLWPWGFTSSVPPNGAGLQTLGRKFAFFNGYTPQHSIGYLIDGSSDDYAYGALGIAGYVWEIGTSFFQDCAYFNNTLIRDNLPALIYAAKVVRTPYLTPEGPDVLNLTLSANNIPAGTPVTLNAIIDDTRYNNTSGIEPVQLIAGAEYYIDNPPWVSGSKSYPLSASDGSFDAASEEITSILDTSLLSSGKHMLFLRGKDAEGNWGAFSATFLMIESIPNQAPVAAHQAVTIDEEMPVSLTLTGSDPDGNPLSFKITGGPNHGKLSGIAPSLSYIPDLNYNGDDWFTFVVNDGEVDSPEAIVVLSVTPVNDAPVADPQPAVISDEDTAKVITLTGSDVEVGELSFIVQTQPTHGSLSGTTPTLTYTPFANYFGTDRFSFVVNDGEIKSEPAMVNITITPVNDRPAANAQSVTTMQDAINTIILTGSDVDGNELIFTIVTQPAQGTLSGTPPNLVYTPVSNYSGTDSFTFKVNDGNIDSAEETVLITLNIPEPGTVNPVGSEDNIDILVMMLKDLFTSREFIDNFKLIETKIDKILQDLFFSQGSR